MLDNKELYAFIEDNLHDISLKRLELLKNIRLSMLLKQNCPLIFKVKFFLDISVIIKALLDIYISNIDDEILDNYLYKLSYYIKKKFKKNKENKSYIGRFQDIRKGKPTVENSKKYYDRKYWILISGEEDFFSRIIKSAVNRVKENNEDYINQYYANLNRFTGEFIKTFCYESGAINWDKLLEFNSPNNFLNTE